jgi:hypothetical protein
MLTVWRMRKQARYARGHGAKARQAKGKDLVSQKHK